MTLRLWPTANITLKILYYVSTIETISCLHYSLGPVYEFVCVSIRSGNLNCFRVK
jgi:hypothetical protein